MHFTKIHRSIALMTLAAVALPAIGSPAMPRPLEKVIWDADLVVIARVDTPPAHRGAPFEFAIEEVLKGEAGEGPFRTTSDVYFNGCMPPPEGTPPPPATEARSERVLLFLGPKKDGIRASRDPIPLAKGQTAGAWFYHSHDALLAPEAVRVLARLDNAEFGSSVTTAWKEGLRSGNSLLAAALLHRIDFVGVGGEWSLGAELNSVAVKQFESARPYLLPLVAELAESQDNALRHLSLAAARSSLPPVGEAERAAFLRCADAAVVSSSSDHDYVRTAGLRYLVAFADQRAPERLFTALSVADAGDRQSIAAIGRDLLRAEPDLAKALLARLMGALDAEWPIGVLRVMTGEEGLTDAAACRKWWDARDR